MSDEKTISKNRRAFHDYFVLEQIEAGLVLVGSEVKSLRNGNVTADEAYAQIRDGKATLHGLTIPRYDEASINNHAPLRPRTLLLHRREIRKLEHRVATERLTVVPLEFYWKRGFAKVLLGVVRGKKAHDKRQSLREKDDKRAMQRALGGRD